MADSPAVITEGISFDVGVSFLAVHVLVGIRGEVDSLTAPALDALLGSVVDGGHADIVLDLGELDFMDASGLGVIARTSTRLRADGGALTIRAPSAMVRRILDITAMSELIEVGLPPSKPTRLGPEQRPGDDSGRVGGISSGSVTSNLAGGAVLPARTDVVDAALRLVTKLARATVGGADGVSVTLSRHGQMTTVAASDETIAQMDRDQYATGEGPCLAAASEGHWFHVESLADEARWPQFVPRAIEGGIASILSTPLVVSARPVGALNIYSNTDRAFGPRDQELAALFATQASAILTEARTDITSEEAGRRLHGALQVRELIAQAQGVVMASRGVSAEVAYGALRQSAKRSGVVVREQAAEIVASTLRNRASREVGP